MLTVQEKVNEIVEHVKTIKELKGKKKGRKTEEAKVHLIHGISVTLRI